MFKGGDRICESRLPNYRGYGIDICITVRVKLYVVK